jgi:glycine cleavage system H protein
VGTGKLAWEVLGNITYCNLPKVGMKWKRQDEFGALQSAKAASELSVPPSEANEVNEALTENPRLSFNKPC